MMVACYSKAEYMYLRFQNLYRRYCMKLTMVLCLFIRGWSGMKRDISEFVSKCLICQQVKAEHQVPLRLLQPVTIPEWKWERVTMDFVSGLPQSPKKKDVIWVIVD
ncbi:integrase [Gossypium australe]|uniref:Integrase n=1 Tax=Gossypium australe TaxID=47621 RepID=A0A5B6VAN8_9ROSI|nr:integrase [Gossypium australe]